MDEVKMIPKGALFLLTEGVYDKYYPQGLFRALDDIHADKLKKEYEEAKRRLPKYYKYFKKFIGSSIGYDKKFCDKVEYFEIWVDDYASNGLFELSEGPD